jgi:nuclear GTP-binding protein
MAKELKGVRANSKKLHGKFNKGSKSNAATNPDRVVKGNTSGVGSTLRTKNTIKRLKMYDQRMPSKEQMHKRPTEAARVDPNRKWFGNVRTIDQKSLEKLRIEIAKKDEDPTKIFVKSKKIPTSLLQEPIK